MVGPGGHCLGHKNTRRTWPAEFVAGVVHVIGADGAYRDPVEVAREWTEEILPGYQPELLDEDKAGEPVRIAAAGSMPASMKTATL